MSQLRMAGLLELFGIASIFGLSSALTMNGNLSTTISTSSASSIPVASITSAPLIASVDSNATCPQCQVVARFGPLSMALWWNSSLKLTLDTVSVLVTQYNNTAVTHTTTIHEDLSSLNISTMSDAQSMAFDVLTAIDPEYEANGFALNNGTQDFIDGTFTVAYPTPFIGIQGFEFISVTKQASQCPKGLQYSGQNLGTTECACMMQTYMDNPNLLDNTITSQITLSSTYYEIANPHPVDNDLSIYLEGPVPINNVSYSSFIESVLGSEAFNKYRSCAFLAAGVGPPALMVPVSALTGSTTATVKSAGNYDVQTPKPGSPVTPIVPPPTTTPVAPPSVPVVKPEPEKNPPPKSSTAPYVAPPSVTPVAEPPVPIVKPSATQKPDNNPGDEPKQAGSQTPAGSPSESSSIGQTGSNGGQNVVGTSNNGNNNDNSNAGGQAVAGQAVAGPQSLDNSGQGSNTGSINPSPAAVVGVSYAGSSIIPDTSSHYDIPQVGKISPGGSPVTTNNVIYSLAPSATALISNGQTISLPTFAAAVPDTVKPIVTPALTFAGSTYTPDSSSRIVVAGQTIVPGAPAVTVSNTPISLAHDASVAVVGGTSQSLYPVLPTPAHLEITFAGATYTANSDSAIVIQGQTLIPGSPAITISNTPISLAPGGNIAVVAGKTQVLAAAGPTARPALSFAGSTYTADASSNIVIAGQTLSPGNVITVSNTPISLAPGASIAVIAGQTQTLSPAAPPPTSIPELSFAGSTYTANAASNFIIQGQTLSPGNVITVSNTPISLAPDASLAVIAGSITQSLALAPTTPPTFTFHGSTYTADASSEFVINGQTLKVGGVLTVSGTPIAFAAGGGDVVVGISSTEVVGGIGGLIMGGFGTGAVGGGGGASATNPVVFTGAAAMRWGGGVVGLWTVGMGLGGVLVLGLRLG